VGSKAVEYLASPSGQVVLGKFPEYLDVAQQVGARAFNIPIQYWNSMTRVEQWAANVKFLDRAIARGDQFLLATSVKDVSAVTGYLRMELDYLISKGYQLSVDGTSLFK